MGANHSLSASTELSKVKSRFLEPSSLPVATTELRCLSWWKEGTAAHKLILAKFFVPREMPFRVVASGKNMGCQFATWWQFEMSCLGVSYRNCNQLFIDAKCKVSQHCSNGKLVTEPIYFYFASFKNHSHNTNFVWQFLQESNHCHFLRSQPFPPRARILLYF